MHSKLFSLEEEIFKVIANEKRLEIIQLLRQGELNVSDMISMLGLRQSNLSQHLTLLRQVGLVNINKKGREIFYSLSSDDIGKSVDAIHSFIKHTYNLAQSNESSPFPFVVDPVCGMRFSAVDAYDSVEKSDGMTAYFCASGCKQVFIDTKLA